MTCLYQSFHFYDATSYHSDKFSKSKIINRKGHVMVIKNRFSDMHAEITGWRHLIEPENRAVLFFITEIHFT